MKRKLKMVRHAGNLVYVAILAASLLSCSNDDNFSPDADDKGRAAEVVSEDVKDIAPSDTTVELSWKGDTVTVSTESTGWWIDRVTVGETETAVAEADKAAMAEGNGFEGKYDWLTVKASGDKIELMAAMHYGEERSFLVWLASENDTVAIKGSQGETPDGIWPDVIGLSTREVALTGFRDTACVTTENVNWWINEIRLDGQQSYRPTLEETEKMAAGELVKIGCGWLAVEREGRKLTIMADVNDGKPRNFSIRLQSGDYFDEIKGTQDEAVIGQWPDMIGLSQDRIAFSAEGGTVSCSTDAKAYWWIPKIEIDGETHLTSSKEQMKCGEERTFNKSIG